VGALHRRGRQAELDPLGQTFASELAAWARPHGPSVRCDEVDLLTHEVALFERITNNPGHLDGGAGRSAHATPCVMTKVIRLVNGTA
jgi:hypothetical protein